MKKVYYLSTCDTCKRIMSTVRGIETFEQIDIKLQNITESDLELAASSVGSFENVFSKRARKYKSEGWKEKSLQESDFKRLILKEYTFLKRPVFFVDDQIFIGNSKKVVNSLVEYMNQNG